MPNKFFDSVEEMISPENLSTIGQERIISVDRKTFNNEGFSGNYLERLTAKTSNGKRLSFILKNYLINQDWVSRITQDHKSREIALFLNDIYQRLPESCFVPMIAVAKNKQGIWSSLMLDVSDCLFPSGDTLISSEDIHRNLNHFADLHTLYWNTPSEGIRNLGLCSEEDWIMLISPQVGKSEMETGRANDVSASLVTGWDLYYDLAPPQAAKIVRDLQENLSPLINAYSSSPHTLLHGDFKYANLGIWGQEKQTLMLDWGVSLYSSPFIELGWFLSVNSAKLSEPKETLIQVYRDALSTRGHTFTDQDWERNLRLGLLGGGTLRLGWAKAFGSQSDDSAIQKREMDEVNWWSEQAILAEKWLG